MTQNIPISDLFSTPVVQADIEIFDPPMCCSTGLCGPTQDQTLLDLSEAIQALQYEGAKVARYQMTTHPNAFLNNSAVMKLVREKQMEALPITVVKGTIIKTSGYPTLDELRTALNGAAK